MSESAPTIASNEDIEIGYVLADAHAPDAETAARILHERAPDEWDVALKPLYPEEAHLQAFKMAPSGDMAECLVECADDDPDVDSRWWVFNPLELVGE